MLARPAKAPSSSHPVSLDHWSDSFIPSAMPPIHESSSNTTEKSECLWCSEFPWEPGPTAPPGVLRLCHLFLWGKKVCDEVRRQACWSSNAVRLWPGMCFPWWWEKRAQLQIQSSNWKEANLSDHAMTSVPRSRRRPMALATENLTVLMIEWSALRGNSLPPCGEEVGWSTQYPLSEVFHPHHAF